MEEINTKKLIHRYSTDTSMTVNTIQPESEMNLATLQEMQKIITEMPVVPEKIEVSADKSCPIVRMFYEFPASDIPQNLVEDNPLFAGCVGILGNCVIPIEENEKLPARFAFIRMSDGTRKLIIAHPIFDCGMKIMDENPITKLFFDELEKGNAKQGLKAVGIIFGAAERQHKS